MSAQIRKSDRVEVKVKNGTNAFSWKPGRVKELSGNGAFVKLDEGHDRFYYLCDIRPEEPAPPPSSDIKPKSSLGTLGDVLRRSIPSPAPSPASAPETPPAPASNPTAATKDDPMPPAPSAPTASSNKPDLAPNSALSNSVQLRVRAKRSLNEIGGLVMHCRQEAGLTLRQVAKMAGISVEEVSGIEQGCELPTDEFLLVLAECMDANLERLIEARARDPEWPTGSKAMSPPAQRAQPKAEASVAAPPPPSARPATRLSFEDFTEQLAAVAAPPAVREKRVRWFAIVRELWELDAM